MITQNQKREFLKKGYLIIKSSKQLKKNLIEIKKELFLFSKVFNKEIKSLSDKRFYKILKKGSSSRNQYYNTIRYLYSLTELESSKFLKKISLQLNLKLPAVMRSYNIRMDTPHDRKHLFQWHQDITYLLGSLNSITYWIPLTKVNKHYGSIEVIEGSHKNGLYDYKYIGREKLIKNKKMSPKDINLKKKPNLKSVIISANPGDIIVFSQFLLHRSTKNKSQKIRWVVQVRHTDISEDSFRNAGFPFGDVTNIFFNNYINKIKK